jgi:hypothetical protein
VKKYWAGRKTANKQNKNYYNKVYDGNFAIKALKKN